MNQTDSNRGQIWIKIKIVGNIEIFSGDHGQFKIHGIMNDK